jgi:ACR3 family arsenite efflux pump ArsB
LKINFLLFTVLPGILGLLLSWVYPAIQLKGLILPALIVVLFPHFIDLNVSILREISQKIKPIILISSIGFLLSPLWAYLISNVLLKNSPPFVIVGFILFALVPGNALMPIFTKMRNADSSLTILFYTVSYALALVFVPIWSQFLLGGIFPIPTMIIIRSFLLVIGTPLLLTSIFRLFYLRNATKERTLKIKAILDRTAFFGLAVIIFSIFAERGQLLLSQPGLVLKVLPAAALLLLACLFSGLILSKVFRLKREIAEAVMIAGTTKNTVIALAIATNAFSNNEAIIVAICGPLTQLPFMLFYVSLAGVLFKQKESVVKSC